MNKKLEIAKFNLRKVLEENVAKKTKLATTGKVVPSRLAHYKTSKLLYSQPIPNTGKKYKCDILLDISGSMYGSELREGIKSVQNLIRLFHGLIDFRITTFASTVSNRSINEVLSWNADKIFEERSFANVMNFRVDSIPIKGGRGINAIEGGSKRDYTGTWGPAALGDSIANLSNTEGEKIIIHITDGEDCMDEFLGAETYGELKSQGIEEISGVDISKYNEDYSVIRRELKEENISILPIGININISHKFSNAIEIDDADEIYEEVINFLGKTV